MANQLFIICANCHYDRYFFESLLTYHAGHWPEFNLPNIYASIPAILAGVLTKSLLAVVITGIVAMAVLRLVGWA